MMRALPLAAALLAAAPMSACRPPPPDPAFAAEWKAWHDARVERLRAPDGWLALVGLDWLEEGANRIEGLPGVFEVGGGAVTLRAAPEDGYTLGGVPVVERRLATDADGTPDRLGHGSRTVQVIERGGRLAVRVWDAASPARTGFEGVPAWPADPRWRVVARWEAYPAPRSVTIPSAAGPEQVGRAPGRAHFSVDGREVSLEPTEDGEALFFVFKDGTAPRESYGGGRFLLAGPPRDGEVVLDFNRAVNPPCAFSPHATCPLPRPENVLPVRIEAGEKRLPGH